MAEAAPHASRRPPPRRRDRGPLAVPSLSQTITLQTAISQRAYHRSYERLKADIYTLTVRTRTLDMDEAADLAETFMKNTFDQIEADLRDDIRRTDVSMEQAELSDTGRYEGAITRDATFTTPQAKRFLDLIVTVDTLVARLDALWLHGVIDTRNCKSRAYEWQRRLFKAANRIREHANSARKSITSEVERRGRRAAPESEQDTHAPPSDEMTDERLDAAVAGDSGDAADAASQGGDGNGAAAPGPADTGQSKADRAPRGRSSAEASDRGARAAAG